MENNISIRCDFAGSNHAFRLFRCFLKGFVVLVDNPLLLVEQCLHSSVNLGVTSLHFAGNLHLFDNHILGYLGYHIHEGGHARLQGQVNLGHACRYG